MIIGFYDADYINQSTFKNYPYLLNYDILKYAGYHVSKRDLVVLLKDLNELERYSKVYYRQDIPGEIPIEILENPNIDFSGYAFYKGNQFLPEEVEQATPYLDIYANVIDYFNKKSGKKIGRMNSGAQMYNRPNIFKLRDVEKFNVDYIYASINYDHNIFEYEDYKERLKIFEKNSVAIYPYKTLLFKIPQFIKNRDQLLAIAPINISNKTPIYIDYYPTFGDWRLFIKNSAYNISSYIWIIRVDSNTELELRNLFINTLKIANYLMAKKKTLTINYKGNFTNYFYGVAFNEMARWLSVGAYGKFFSYAEFITHSKYKWFIEELLQKDKELKELSNISPIEVNRKGGIILI